MNSWAKSLESEITTENIKEIVSPFFLEQSVNEELSICNICINKVNEYLNSLTEDNWKDALKDERSYELNASLIIDYKYQTNATEALKDLLKDIATGSTPIPDKGKLGMLVKRIEGQGKNMKGTFNAVRDSFCREDNMTIALFKFFGEWLFKYSDLEDKKESLRTIFTADIINDDDCCQIMMNHQMKMPAIMEAAGEEAQDFKEIVREKLEKEDSESFVSFARIIGVTVSKEKKDNKKS